MAAAWTTNVLPMTTLALILALLLVAAPWWPLVHGQEEENEETAMDLNLPTDGINLALTSFPDVDLNKLGTPNWDRYEGSYEVTVDDNFCEYIMTIKFKHDATNPAGPWDFVDACDPAISSTASDGKAWHEPRKDWIRLPDYVFQATGFQHVGLEWKPCGAAPLGLRQGRYDLNLYMVPPEYRALMTCTEHQTPSICQFNQTSVIGRQHFSLPLLWANSKFVPNMPVDFQPDALYPEAFAHEGLISFDTTKIPATSSAWILPTFHMSTFDADVISWRAMIPYSFIGAGNPAEFNAGQAYVYQTIPTLPKAWNMTFDPTTGFTDVLIVGDAGLCASEFATAKADFEASEQA
jgi:hypothetical protein